MKLINLLGAAIALVMAAAPAFAVNWVYITTDDNGADYYYDADTIQRSSNQVTVWERWDHSSDKKTKERERKVRFRYDCAERTRTALHLINYYPDGTSKSFTWKAYEQETDPLAPGTLGDDTLEAICAATAP